MEEEEDEDNAYYYYYYYYHHHHHNHHHHHHYTCKTTLECKWSNQLAMRNNAHQIASIAFIRFLAPCIHGRCLRLN